MQMSSRTMSLTGSRMALAGSIRSFTYLPIATTESLLLSSSGRLVQGKVHWYYDTLTPKMAIFEIIVDEAIEYIVEQVAKELEDYMKSEAPWEDQTGAARDGLRAEAFKDGSTHVITLYHTVDYGIWLEVRYNG